MSTPEGAARASSHPGAPVGCRALWLTLPDPCRGATLLTHAVEGMTITREAAHARADQYGWHDPMGSARPPATARTAAESRVAGPFGLPGTLPDNAPVIFRSPQPTVRPIGLHRPHQAVRFGHFEEDPMTRNHQRNRIDREQGDPGSTSQAAALAAAGLARDTQSQDGAGDVAGQGAARPGRGWDDLSPEALFTDQTTRRPQEK